LGSEQIWDTQVNADNPMMTGRARLLEPRRRVPKLPPDYCKRGRRALRATLSAAGTPEGFVQNARQDHDLRSKLRKFTLDTCFGTHHLNFAEDANNTSG